MTAGLGDGEKLETNSDHPDYVRLALTSRVYDMVNESPLQYASGEPPTLTIGSPLQHASGELPTLTITLTLTLTLAALFDR